MPDVMAGDWVRLLEPKGPGGCDVSNLIEGAVHQVVSVKDQTLYFARHYHGWCWRRDSVEWAPRP